MKNPGNILTAPPPKEIGERYEIWLIHKRGLWLAHVPALPAASVKMPEREDALALAKHYVCAIIGKHRAEGKAAPWERVTRSAPLGAEVRRLRITTINT